jgi:hypothetical protein
LWQKSYEPIGYDFDGAIASIIQTEDGNYLAAGRYVLKIDANGNILWSKNYGDEYGLFYSIQPTVDDGYILAGESFGNYSNGDDAWIVKIDGSGNVIWQKKIWGQL